LAEQLTHDPNFECSSSACAASMGDDNGKREKSFIVESDISVNFAEQLTHDPSFECSSPVCAASMGDHNGNREKVI
jgi:hypothetical protein